MWATKDERRAVRSSGRDVMAATAAAAAVMKVHRARQRPQPRVRCSTARTVPIATGAHAAAVVVAGTKSRGVLLLAQPRAPTNAPAQVRVRRQIQPPPSVTNAATQPTKVATMRAAVAAVAAVAVVVGVAAQIAPTQSRTAVR